MTSMKSKLIIAAAVVLVLGGIYYVFWFSSTSRKSAGSLPPTGVSTSTFPGSGSPAAGTGSGIQRTLAASDGGTIIVSDFLSNSDTVKDPINNGYYYLGYHPYEGVNDPTVNNNPPYSIWYEADSNFFSIALLHEPIGTTRLEMEQYLKGQLQISESDLCRLKYSVTVPVWVNQMYAGEELGFSFCPNSVPLPQ